MSRIRSLAAAGIATLLMTSIVPGAACAAQGVSLAWNHCLAQGTGVQNASFACDVNIGLHQLVGGFTLSSNMPGVTGAEIVIQLASASPALPAWWQVYNAGSCRSTSLVVNSTPDPDDAACEDWSQGQMFVGIGTYCTSSGSCVDHPSVANEVRLKLVEAVPSAAAASLTPAHEYFAFNIIINHQKTVGAGACAGCEVPVCIVLNSINVVAGASVNRFISTSSSPGSNYVTWQGGGGTNCPAATPARNSTWGSVKSLYR